jgi:FkbH-like protein
MKNENLLDFKPDNIFIILDGDTLFNNVSDYEKCLVDTFKYIKLILENFSMSKVYVSSISFRSKYINIANINDIRKQIIHLWDIQLSSLIDIYHNFRRFDLDRMISEFGLNNFYSKKMWYLGSIPFSLSGLKAIAELIIEKIEVEQNYRRKVLILDLDNTLWGGVIGDDGIDGIQLSDRNIGAIYRDAQKVIKMISHTGVLLAICSKNNEKTVLDAFKNHDFMELHEDDFAIIKANWDHKYENILTISKELNLGTDSFVFIDDNEIEREFVKENLPDVIVPDFPKNILDLSDFFVDIYYKYFSTSRMTNEDRQKSEMYKLEKERKKVASNHKNIDSFIKSLEIEMEIGLMEEVHFDRVLQLTNKTNQFNLTTKRLDANDLLEFYNKNLIFTSNVKDKFGPYGLVGILFISVDDETATIENFIMSCRVMNRGIEDSFIYHVEQYLINIGIKNIYARYLSTKKNHPVVNLWDRLGYSLIFQSDRNNEKKYLKTQFDVENNQLILVKWREE